MKQAFSRKVPRYLAAAWLLASCFCLPASAAPGKLLLQLKNPVLTSGSHFSGTPLPFTIDLPALANLKKGDTPTLEMPDGSRLPASATRVKALIKGSTQRHTVLSLKQGKGALELFYRAGRINRARLIRVGDKIRVFEAELDHAGQGQWIEQDANNHFCIDMPTEAEAEAAADTGTTPQFLTAPSENDLRILESKPRANNVLYLNFWGGVLSDTIWNDTYIDDGAPITYSRYSYDDDINNFSEADRERMWIAWREVTEDFAPFDVNVTTSQTVYDRTPSEDRSMVIATASNWYGSAGGVAEIDSFGKDYYGVAWVWNKGLDAFGQTISHEAGHQMDLRHWGQWGQPLQEEYYTGHGANNEWGPIMGAPHGKTFVQWSRGDYPDAKNISTDQSGNITQSDLIDISAVLGEDQDVIGDSHLTAQPITSLTFFEGRIEPLGLLGVEDSDFYSFTLGSPQTVRVEIRPLLGDISKQYGSNLALDAQLLDANLNLIEASAQAPPYHPQDNVLYYDDPLASGTYYLKVKAQSPDTNWSTGFDDYGNAGLYTVQVSSAITPEPDLTVQLHVEDTDVYRGQAVRMTAAVQNIGNATAAAGTARYYRSDTLPVGTDDEQAVFNTDALEPLEYDYIDALLSLPDGPDTPSQIYYGVCVELDSENVDGNNCSAPVEFTVSDSGVDTDIGEAVEQPAPRIWLRGGDKSFYREIDAAYHDGDAARSPAIDHDEISWVQSDFQGPGWVRFDWKVSSEATFDYLRLLDNSVQVAAISGEVDWTSYTYELPTTGLHSLQWQYNKDPFTKAGLDSAWLDKVENQPRLLELVSPGPNQAEGDTGTNNFIFNLKLYGDLSSAASVNYSVTGAGSNPASTTDFADNTYPSGTINFAAGETEKTITIQVKGDSTLEPDESFLLSLSSPTNALLGASTQLQGKILNDDDGDNDGISDTDDNCPLIDNPDQADNDNDDFGDVCDDDDDNDGISDTDDNCPLIDNPGQADNDNDDFGDPCDNDDDNDGNLDGDDNCPHEYNPAQDDICTLCFPVVIPPENRTAIICL